MVLEKYAIKKVLPNISLAIKKKKKVTIKRCVCKC